MSQPTKEELLEVAKIEADTLGIEYKDNVTLAALTKKIDSKKVTPKKENSTEEDSEIQEFTKKYKNKIRVQISCNDPKLRNYTTTPPISVSNAIMKETAFVPLNVPWHVSQLILDTIKEQKFIRVEQVKNPNGRGRPIERKSIANKYNVAILPPLTEDELEELKVAQQARGD
jgi:preprotein translocase subunit Sss1